MIVFEPVLYSKFTRDEALMYQLFCNHNGHLDWRFPTRDEYYTTLDLRDCWDQQDVNNSENISTQRVILVRDSDDNPSTSQ